MPEILTVVAIMGVLAAVAMFSLSGSGNDQNAAALARSIQFAMLRARTEALSDGAARQLRCGPTIPSTTICNNGICSFSGCALYMATTKGNAPIAWTDEGNNVQASSHAWIWNITATVPDIATNAGASQMTSNVNITFYPTGATTTGASNVAPTGATVFVCDKTGGHRYKVFAYAGTGLSRLVTTW
jgi:type II secretory pathway pseudopilin PulG